MVHSAITSDEHHTSNQHSGNALALDETQLRAEADHLGSKEPQRVSNGRFIRAPTTFRQRRATCRSCNADQRWKAAVAAAAGGTLSAERASACRTRVRISSIG